MGLYGRIRKLNVKVPQYLNHEQNQTLFPFVLTGAALILAYRLLCWAKASRRAPGTSIGFFGSYRVADKMEPSGFRSSARGESI